MSQTLASRAGNRALVGVCLVLGVALPLLLGGYSLWKAEPKATMLLLAALSPLVTVLAGATAAAVGSWYLLPKPWSRWIAFAVIALTAAGFAALGLWYVTLVSA